MSIQCFIKSIKTLFYVKLNYPFFCFNQSIDHICNNIIKDNKLIFFDNLHNILQKTSDHISSKQPNSQTKQAKNSKQSIKIKQVRLSIRRMQFPTSSSQDPKIEQLYQQFLDYMKGTESKSMQAKLEQQYKRLYSQIFQSNMSKKSLLSLAANKEINMKLSGDKFTKILGGYKQLSTIKDRYVLEESRIAAQVDIQQLDDQILMQQMHKKQLQQQIDNYKAQINRKTKLISEYKNKIKLIDLQQNKFAQAEHLAHNILHYTDQFSLVNVKNYNKMLEEQESILSKLKKMRTKAKNQLNQMQYNYVNLERQHQLKFKKLIKTCIPTSAQNSHTNDPTVPKKFNLLSLNGTSSNNNSCINIGVNSLYQNSSTYGSSSGNSGGKQSKNIKKFIEYIEKVLLLLEEKEQNFQLIKQEECTKIKQIGKKIDINVLIQAANVPRQSMSSNIVFNGIAGIAGLSAVGSSTNNINDMIQLIKKVEQFQLKFQMRVESTDKILVKLFKQIKQSNESIQKCIFQHRCILQDYQQQYKILCQKITHFKELEDIQMQKENENIIKENDQERIYSKEKESSQTKQKENDKEKQKQTSKKLGFQDTDLCKSKNKQDQGIQQSIGQDCSTISPFGNQMAVESKKRSKSRNINQQVKFTKTSSQYQFQPMTVSVQQIQQPQPPKTCKNIKKSLLPYHGQYKQAKRQEQKKFQKVHTNSLIFVQIMEVINSLLLKFRYVFKLFIMLNIDKRKLNDHLLKLDQILNNRGLYSSVGCTHFNDSTLCNLGRSSAKVSKKKDGLQTSGKQSSNSKKVICLNPQPPSPRTQAKPAQSPQGNIYNQSRTQNPAYPGVSTLHSNYQSTIFTYMSNNQQTNAIDMLEVFVSKFEEMDLGDSAAEAENGERDGVAKIREFLYLFFNDLRAALIWRKNMVNEELDQYVCTNPKNNIASCIANPSESINSSSKTSSLNIQGSQSLQNQKRTQKQRKLWNWQVLVKILQSIRQQCEYSYNQKLKSSLNILFDCLKSSVKNGNSGVNGYNYIGGNYAYGYGYSGLTNGAYNGYQYGTTSNNNALTSLNSNRSNQNTQRNSPNNIYSQQAPNSSNVKPNQPNNILSMEFYLPTGLQLYQKVKKSNNNHTHHQHPNRDKEKEKDRDRDSKEKIRSIRERENTRIDRSKSKNRSKIRHDNGEDNIHDNDNPTHKQPQQRDPNPAPSSQNPDKFYFQSSDNESQSDQPDISHTRKSIKQLEQQYKRTLEREQLMNKKINNDRKNPSNLVRKLANIRNVTIRNYQNLDLHENQKKYITTQLLSGLGMLEKDRERPNKRKKENKQKKSNKQINFQPKTNYVYNRSVKSSCGNRKDLSGCYVEKENDSSLHKSNNKSNKINTGKKQIINVNKINNFIAPVTLTQN